MSEHRRRQSTPPGGEPGPLSPHRSPAGGAPQAFGEAPAPRSRTEARQAQRAGGGGRGRGSGGSGGSGGGRRGGGGGTPPGGSDTPGRNTAGPGRGRGGRPVKKRFIDYPRAGKYGVWRWLPSFKQILAMFVLFFGAIIGAIGIAYAMVKIPDPNAGVNTQSNVYYYSDGKTELGRSGAVNRTSVGLDQIPMPVQKAVLAAENASFYTDSGVSPKGLTRAAVNMAKGGETQGGSTITQQYVKNYFLNQDQNFTRKFKEMFIAVKIDRQLSKDQILEGYLNTIFFGRRTYGIQAASKAYYGKDAKDLTLAEGAYMATLLNAPITNDWQVYESRRPQIEAKWRSVLTRMVKEGWLDKATADATQFPQPLKPQPQMDKSGQAGYLMTQAENYLTKNKVLDEKSLARGGYKIVTTFDKDKQDAAVAAVDKAVTSQLDPGKREADKYVREGLASVIPGDGAVVALYGGPDFLKQERNDATRQDVQVGSTFKAFVLAAALRDGKHGNGQPISPESVYNGDSDIKIYQKDGKPYKGDDGKDYVPGNESKTDYGPITIRKAMEVSANSVFVQLAADAEPERVKKAAMDAGIPDLKQDFEATPTIALGVSQPSALNMAEAYATFAARGKHAQSYFVKELTHDGDKVTLPEHKVEQVFSETVADTVNDVLVSVVKNGSGRKAQELDRPAAGKTGTTNMNKSAWFAGYTPNLATAVGLFREDPDTYAKLTLSGVAGNQSTHGSGLPASLWTEYMKAALKGMPKQDFTQPDDLGDKQNGINSSPSPSPTPSSSTSSAPATSQPPTTPATSQKPDPTSSSTSSTGWNDGGWLSGNTGKPDPGQSSGTPGGDADGNTTQGRPGGSTQGRPGGTTRGGFISGQQGD